LIKAPASDKQTMFECAEVLNEILNAVEKGRKVLRIDHTPYRIYSLYKKKLPKTKQPIEELVEEEDVEDRKRKVQAVKNFVDKHS
jgi:GTP cyclohydrolase I